MHWKAFWSAFIGAYLGSLVWELVTRDDDTPAPYMEDCL